MAGGRDCRGARVRAGAARRLRDIRPTPGRRCRRARTASAASTRCRRCLSFGLCIHGSQVSSASVSRLRNRIASSLVGQFRGVESSCLRDRENSSLFSLVLRHREDIGDVELVDGAGLDADRADQHEVANALRRLASPSRPRSSRRSSSRRCRSRRGRGGPAARDRRSAMSSTLSSQSGRLDLPKPGCDGAMRRRRAANGGTKGCAGSKPLAPCSHSSGWPRPASNSSTSMPASLTTLVFKRPSHGRARDGAVPDASKRGPRPIGESRKAGLRDAGRLAPPRNRCAPAAMQRRPAARGLADRAVSSIKG